MCGRGTLHCDGGQLGVPRAVSSVLGGGRQMAETGDTGSAARSIRDFSTDLLSDHRQVASSGSASGSPAAQWRW